MFRLGDNREIMQLFQKWSPELRIFAGVQRKSCSKKYKKNLGLRPNVHRCLTKNSGENIFQKVALFLGYLLLGDNRRNNPTFSKVVAGVENFRRSATQKLLKKMRKQFRYWSQRAQTLNEKLRRNHNM